MTNNFIKCFSKEGCDQLLAQGVKFLFEADGVYWFTFDSTSDSVNFTCDSDYKITSRINI